MLQRVNVRLTFCMTVNLLLTDCFPWTFSFSSFHDFRRNDLEKSLRKQLYNKDYR